MASSHVACSPPSCTLNSSALLSHRTIPCSQLYGRIIVFYPGQHQIRESRRIHPIIAPLSSSAERNETTRRKKPDAVKMDTSLQTRYVAISTCVAPPSQYYGCRRKETAKGHFMNRSLQPTLGRCSSLISTPHETPWVVVGQHDRKISTSRCYSKTIEGGQNIDRATAKALAFGSLALEKIHVRISGQDVERDTFSQCHAVVHDQENERQYVPLNDLGFYQAKFVVCTAMHAAHFLHIPHAYVLIVVFRSTFFVAKFAVSSVSPLPSSCLPHGCSNK
ncbi:hypothetical protein BC629DRAFT_1726320 [Irpex lacteus]|nr:hypothetical protein BC629DRAFT_1726320 [Irpex lacteus]